MLYSVAYTCGGCGRSKKGPSKKLWREAQADRVSMRDLLRWVAAGDILCDDCA